MVRMLLVFRGRGLGIIEEDGKTAWGFSGLIEGGRIRFTTSMGKLKSSGSKCWFHCHISMGFAEMKFSSLRLLLSANLFRKLKRHLLC